MNSVEAQNVVRVMRALIISEKNPTKIHDLLKDYREMEGSVVPFRRFGFNNIECFLKESGEFELVTHRGESCVTVRPNKDTIHISNMIAYQRVAKKKNSSRMRMRSRPCANRAPLKSSDRSWNKSSYSSNFYRNNNTSQQNLLKFGQHRFINNDKKIGDTNNNLSQPNKNFMNIQQQKNTNNISDKKFGGSAVSSYTEIKDLREKLNINREQNFQKRNIPTVDLTVVPDKLNDQKFYNQKSTFRDVREKLYNKTDLTLTSNNKMNNVNHFVETNEEKKSQSSITQKKNDNLLPDIQIILNKQLKLSGGSVQDRLNRYRKNSSDNLELKCSTRSSPPALTPQLSLPSSPVNNNSNFDDLNLSKNSLFINKKEKSTVIIEDKSSTKQLEKRIIKTKIDTADDFSFDDKLDVITQLEKYCIKNFFKKPYYEKMKPKYSKKIQCRVTINGIMYSTYPKDYNDIETAQVACAQIAIDQIKKSIAIRSSYPLWMGSDQDLEIKIYNNLKENHHPQGIFVKAMPKVFEQMFRMTLPEHWFSVINNSNLFNVEKTAGDDIILINSITQNESECGTSESIKCNELILPWNEKYWNIFVTDCSSTTCIWARIIGKDYSEELDSLTNDIELSMMTHKQRPQNPTVGLTYLVCLSECWHRVNLERINKDSGTCTCFFLDFGDEEVIPVDQLYVCDKKFLKFPAQAIVLSLFGLEDFAENPIAKRYLDDMLTGKSLVAEILTKQENFVKNCDDFSNKSSNDISTLKKKIQCVLYDTSNPIVDINLNPLLLKKICDETPPPELKPNCATNVNITHITNDAEVFLQIRNAGLLYIQKLIYQLVESKFQEDHHRVTLDDIKRSDLFLIHDSSNNKWYRGSLANNIFEINSEYFDINYVDYGIIKKTHVSKIFRLESLSTALSKFPKQAIKTKLFNLPPVNETIVARVRALLSIDSPAIVKLVQIELDNGNFLPLITAYVRFDRNHSLCNVNESIKIEYELASSAEISLNDFIDNQQKTKGSSETSFLQGSVENKKINLPKLIESPLPKEGDYFSVFVTVASNPYNFLVRPYDLIPNFQQTMLELKEYCRKNEEFIPNDMIEIGEAYAYIGDDEICYRIEVEDIYPSEASCVTFSDFGDVAVVDNRQLRILPSKFRILPKQAIQAKLANVKPIYKDWTSQDCIRFREMTVQQKFVSIVKKITIDDFNPKKQKRSILELQLIDVQTNVDIYIDKILIDEKRALKDD